MSNNEYFDLTTTGVGFINRFRLNKPDQGSPYYSVTIAAMRGKANEEGKIKKTYIDCNVLGNAVDMAKELTPYFEGENDPSIMIGFVMGDLEQRSFIYKSGDRKGQNGFALKGRLFDIKWFKVNGKIFYSEAERLRHEAETQAEDNQSSEAQNEGSKPESHAEQSPDGTESSATVQSENDATDNLPKEVKLVKDDPYFEERKAQLKQQGYRWNNDSQLWVLAEPVAA